MPLPANTPPTPGSQPFSQPPEAAAGARAPVVVVGAGIAGLACARRLADAGLPVVVLERQRGVGGRMASRTVAGCLVDHGAQYVTASGPELAALLRRLAATGLAEPWATRLHQFAGGRLGEGGEGESGRVRWAFPAGMAIPARQLAGALDVRLRRGVAAMEPADGGWLLATSGGGRLAARAVVLALPAPQAAALLGRDRLAAVAARAAYDPCWALLAGYPDAPPPTWRGMFVRDGRVLAWVAHDSSKRRDPPATVLVAHATGDWTRARLDADPGRVTAELLRATARVAGRWAAAPAWTGQQLWPYAQVRRGVEEPWLLGGDAAPVGLCGDWCAGAKVEGAFRSGSGLGKALAERLA
jgi:renalase